MIWRVHIWRWLLWMLKAALCDNLKNYILKASVFSAVFLSVLCQKHCLYMYYQHWGALYENNRLRRIYEGTCYFSNKTSQFGKKRCLNRSDIFPKTSFCNAFYSFSVTLIWLKPIYWHFTAIPLLEFSCAVCPLFPFSNLPCFILLLRLYSFTSFCIVIPTWKLYFAKLQVFVIPVNHVWFSFSFTDGQFLYWA